MKILIITHPRSGGKSLLEWISYEKGYKSYHEPNLMDLKILNEIYNDNYIVVKILIGDLTKMGVDFNYVELFKKFNVVISHKRNNLRDVAISLLKGEQDNIWHHTYEITNEWLEKYNNEIEKEIDNVRTILFNLNQYHQDSFFYTTYESIFINKTDIDSLCSTLKIEEPVWLDILDNKRKLRNGNIGMNKFNPTKRSII